MIVRRKAPHLASALLLAVLGTSACGAGDTATTRRDAAEDTSVADSATSDTADGSPDAGRSDACPEAGGCPGELPPPTPTFVRTLVEMPEHGFHAPSRRSVPLGPVMWTGEYFSLPAGHCHPGSETRGFWVYTRDGTLVQERHICQDALAPREDKDHLWLELHNWGVGTAQHALTPRTILREAAVGTGGHSYPPMIYTITDPSTVELTERPFAMVTDSPESPPDTYATRSGTGPRFVRTVVVGDVVVGVLSGEGGRLQVRSLPDLAVLTEFDSPLLPITTLGDLVLAVDSSAGQIGLYRFSGTSLELLQARAIPNYRTHHVESTGTRLAVYDPSQQLRIFELEGERLVERVPARDSSSLGFGVSTGPAVLLEGDLLMVGWNMWHRGVRIPLPPLPDEVDLGGARSPAGVPRGAALSDDGRLVVNTVYGAYLYDLYP